MMRKRSIMSLLLAFCLCFAMTVPALAVNTEFAVEENSEISLLSEMQIEGRFYNLTDLTADELVAEQANIARQINALAIEVEQEFADIDVSATNGLPITVELTEINDDYTYVYSQTEGEDAQVAMYETEPLDVNEVAVLSEQEIQETYLKEETNEVTDLLLGVARALTGCTGPCTYTTDIPGGLGARLPMKYNNGTIQSFSVVTSNSSKTIEPLDSKGKSLNGACFLYGGFDATCNGKACNSDLGLVYQKMKGTNTWAWKPFYRVTYYKTSTTQVSIQSDKYNLNATDENGNDGQVWGANGYIPGEKIDIQVRIDAVGNKSDVVLRTAGYAFHSTSNGTGSNTYLVQAYRYKNNGNYFPKITNANDWKLLAHPANDNISTANDAQIVKTFVSGDFSNIKINNNIPTFSQVEKDYGYAQKKGDNAYFLQSCKGI